MMLARVADSLYWIGRYVERAEHLCRLSDVMLNATLDRNEAAGLVSRIVLSAVGDAELHSADDPYQLALALALDRHDGGSIVSSLARARETELLHRFDAVRYPAPERQAQAGQFRGIEIAAVK